MKPQLKTVELVGPDGVIELKVVKNGLAQARPEPVDRNKPAWIKAPLPTGATYQRREMSNPAAQRRNGVSNCPT